MITLLLATHNLDKVKEMAHALQGLPLRVASLDECGVNGEVEETGSTLAENAWLKAGAAPLRPGMLCVADDTGLEVDALGGAPGVRSSRFAGEKVTYRDNVEKLLREMAAVEEARRTARFRCVVALLGPEGRRAEVQGVAEGRILRAPQGEGGFGYDPVFWVPEAGKSFAEMSLEEKDRFSHRGKALREARRVLGSWLGTEPGGA
jgi:XTP/dITP diphosphohydrolase